MRLLFCGDIFGRSGRDCVIQNLPRLRQELKIHFIIVNGENAAAGFGISPAICEELFQAGCDVITTGNHAWSEKTIAPYMGKEKRVLRPFNYPKGTPGQGVVEIKSLHNDFRLVVIQMIGRLFMDPFVDDPFSLIDTLLSSYRLGPTAIFIDFHGEASSEKAAFAYYVDGRVSAVIGSHTHIPTADHRILPKGTAYQTDAGMCGDYNSVIGLNVETALHKFLRKGSGARPAPAEGKGTLCGSIVDIHPTTGLCVAIHPLRLSEDGILSSTALPA
jgi:hypothetical protein